MSPRDIDYDVYWAKHCARYYGWLPASKAHKKNIQRAPKYFTLCGSKAIDLFMLEFEKVLERDKNRKLPNVIVCEDNEEAWTEILDLVRPPVKEAIILGRLQDILTFEDDENTKGRSPDDDEPSFEIRKKLIIKGSFEQLQKHFPFDIVNFDPCESLLDTNLEVNGLYQAFNRILELQKSIDSFLFFITTEITPIHPDVQSRFKTDLESNISMYPKIGKTLSSLAHATAYDMIENNKRVALGFAKSVVLSAARSKGWNCEHQGIYIYEFKRPGGTRMLSSVVKFSKAHNTPDEATYIQDLIKIIKHMPKYYSYDEASKNEEVKNHLQKVKEYREKVRKEHIQEL
ncbi:MAG: hypothetical protein MUO85_10860 [candidate division Zixibacteria bacterium]|nr:hypothetical protein [candidate division Zixibacteria bacterium]